MNRQDVATDHEESHQAVSEFRDADWVSGGLRFWGDCKGDQNCWEHLQGGDGLDPEAADGERLETDASVERAIPSTRPSEALQLGTVKGSRALPHPCLLHEAGDRNCRDGGLLPGSARAAVAHRCRQVSCV